MKPFFIRFRNPKCKNDSRIWFQSNNLKRTKRKGRNIWQQIFRPILFTNHQISPSSSTLGGRSLVLLTESIMPRKSGDFHTKLQTLEHFAKARLWGRTHFNEWKSTPAHVSISWRSWRKSKAHNSQNLTFLYATWICFLAEDLTIMKLVKQMKSMESVD